MRLIYMTNASLDGYIADDSGSVDWDNVEQLHPLFVELLLPIGTFLYGRRLYEMMAYWDAPAEDYPAQHRDFARIWQKPEKIVFSRTLANVTTRRTRLERNFDPGAIRKVKRESEHDLCIGGAELASLAIQENLVDECHLLLHPVILGRGKPAFSPSLRRKLELLAARSVGTGVIHAHYRVNASG